MACRAPGQWPGQLGQSKGMCGGLPLRTTLNLREACAGGPALRNGQEAPQWNRKLQLPWGGLLRMVLNTGASLRSAGFFSKAEQMLRFWQWLSQMRDMQPGWCRGAEGSCCQDSS